MDTSSLLQSIVIDPGPLLQWKICPLSSRDFFFVQYAQKDALRRERYQPLLDSNNDDRHCFCAYCTNFLGYLDEIKTQEYDGIEVQGIKNSLRSFLQGTEAILPDTWETLYCSSDSAKRRALSPCNGFAFHVLRCGTTYIDVQTVNIFTGRLSNSRGFCWTLERCPVFLLESRMNKTLRSETKLLNCTYYTTSRVESQYCTDSLSCRLVSTGREAQ